MQPHPCTPSLITEGEGERDSFACARGNLHDNHIAGYLDGIRCS